MYAPYATEVSFTFWKVFIIDECWILSKAPSASIGMIIWFLFFNLLMRYITLIDLNVLKNSCILGINLTWWWNIVGAGLLVLCWGFLHISSSVILACSFGFFVWYLGLVLVSGWWWPHRMSSEVFFLCNFLEQFQKDRS